MKEKDIVVDPTLFWAKKKKKKFKGISSIKILSPRKMLLYYNLVSFMRQISIKILT